MTNIHSELQKIIPLISCNVSDKILIVSNQQLFFVLKCLKMHFGYQYALLSCLSGVDFLGKRYRFAIV